MVSGARQTDDAVVSGARQTDDAVVSDVRWAVNLKWAPFNTFLSLNDCLRRFRLSPLSSVSKASAALAPDA